MLYKHSTVAHVSWCLTLNSTTTTKNSYHFVRTKILSRCTIHIKQFVNTIHQIILTQQKSMNFICNMTHLCVWHVAFVCVTLLMQMFALTDTYVWQDSFIWVTWFIHVSTMTYSHACDICVTCLIYMRAMTLIWICDRNHWYDAFICVTWLVHMCDMLHLYVGQESFIYVTLLFLVCDITHSYVCPDSFMKMIAFILTLGEVM